MIVLDTSALMAVILQEAEAPEFLTILSEEADLWISSASAYEAAVVAATRKRNPAAATLVDRLLREMQVQTAPFADTDAAAAREAYFRYGKGFHRAGLNFGDCIAYALAKSMNAPLLFKGDDFSRTDIDPAWKTAAKQ